MRGLSAALVVFAILVAVFGLLTLTHETQGAGVIAATCLVAIVARLAHAQAHASESPRHVIKRQCPPAVGDVLRLDWPVLLYERANARSKIVASVPSGRAMQVIDTVPGWIFVRSEDWRPDGWDETGQAAGR